MGGSKLRLTVGAALAAACLVAIPGSARACQLDGWTARDAAMRASVIVEADVVAVLPNHGYELAIRRLLKGTTGGSSFRIGAESPGAGDCGGRIGLEVGDHVLMALRDPRTASAFETAVWWIDSDGIVERASLAENPRPTTIDAILRELIAALPDTATEDTTPARSPMAVGWLVVAFLAGILVASRRMRTDEFSADPWSHQ